MGRAAARVAEVWSGEVAAMVGELRLRVVVARAGELALLQIDISLWPLSLA